MNKNTKKDYLDLDIKLQLGNILLNILYVNYQPPTPSWGFSNHMHSSYELHFIPSGKGTLMVSDKRYDILPGTFYLTGPGIFHEQMADAYEPMCEYCINFEINILKPKSKKTDIFIKNESDEIINILHNTNFWFGSDEFLSLGLLEKIMSEFETSLIGYYSYIQNLLGLIILNTVRCITSQKISEYHIPKKILNDSRRYQVDDYFKDINKVLNPSELAAIIGTSTRQLNRILKQYYSMTFNERLTYCRLEQAKNLLKNSNLSIKEISEIIGFSNSNYFSSVFHKMFGLPPVQYRIK